jgi:hypothetical protein
VSTATQVLLWWGLGCGFFQPALPPPPSRLLPLGLQGRKVESPASTRNLVVSIHNIARQVLDYSTRGVYLLRRSLGDVQLFGDALACHIVRPSRRRRQTSLQASRTIINEGHVGQSRAAEPGLQLEPLLERLLVLLIGRILNDDSVFTFADLAVLSGLAFPLLWNIHKSGRRSWLRDKVYNIILQHIAWVSMTTTIQPVLGHRVRLLTLFDG